MDAAKAFGRVLRQQPLGAGLTQETLGFEADLRRTYISILELGHQQPTLTTILKLAGALQMTAHDLVGMVETELTAKKPAKRR